MGQNMKERREWAIKVGGSRARGRGPDKGLGRAHWRGRNIPVSLRKGGEKDLGEGNGRADKWGDGVGGVQGEQSQPAISMPGVKRGGGAGEDGRERQGGGLNGRGNGWNRENSRGLYGQCLRAVGRGKGRPSVGGRAGQQQKCQGRGRKMFVWAGEGDYSTDGCSGAAGATKVGKGKKKGEEIEA